MTTAVAKGQYWTARTKRYLTALGYVVEPLQLMAWIKTARGFLPVKRDAFASDLLAVSAEKILFVQVKGGETRRSQLAAARQAFAKYPLPEHAEHWIVCWAPRSRMPEIEVVARGPQRADHPVEKVLRKKPKSLPLFSASAR